MSGLSDTSLVDMRSGNGPAITPATPHQCPPLREDLRRWAKAQKESCQVLPNSKYHNGYADGIDALLREADALEGSTSNG